MGEAADRVEAQLREANERINRRSGRPLLLAIVIGVVLAAALFASLLWVKALFMVFAGVLVGFMAWELATALRLSGRRVPRIPALIGALATVPAAFYFGISGQWLVLIGAVALVTIWRGIELALGRDRVGLAETARDLGGGLFVITYTGFLPAATVLLVSQPGGEWWTIAFLSVTIGSDIAAYVVGLNFGRHKMAPTISPAKSWEGFAGAAGLSVVVGIVLGVFLLGIPWWGGLIFGIVLLLAGVAGDLVESLIKRDLGVKDISTWLPGHGGFLDRFDSALLAGPVAYLFYLIFAGGTIAHV